MSSFKISAKRASDTARQLVAELSAPDTDVDRLATDFATRLSPSSRLAVYPSLPGLLASGTVRLDDDRFHRFLQRQFDGVKRPYFQRHIESILSCATRCAPGAAAALICDLVYDRLAMTPSDADLRAVAHVVGASSIVLRALEMAADSGNSSPEALVRWSQCLGPLLETRQDGERLGSDAAHRVHQLLASLGPGAVPADSPTATDAPKKPADSPSDDSGVSPAPPRAARSAPPLPTAFRDIVAAISAAALADQRQIDALRRRASEYEAALSRAQSALKQAQEEGDQDRRQLTERISVLECALDDRQRVLREMELSLQEARRAADTWSREAELARGEVRLQLVQRDEEVRHRLRSALSRPTKHVRDRLTQVMSERPDESMRLLAATFDNLHVRILRLLDEPETERIAPHLLGDPREGGSP